VRAAGELCLHSGGERAPGFERRYGTGEAHHHEFRDQACFDEARFGGTGQRDEIHEHGSHCIEQPSFLAKEKVGPGARPKED
jgi:hypothetical protein